MIVESWPWKNELLETAERLKLMKTLSEPSEEQLVQLEKDIFIGFYIVRKLFETITKVTDSTKALKLDLFWYPNRKPVTWRNNHKLDELYDFAASQAETRDALYVCNQLIHSFIFSPLFDEDEKLHAILFTSDKRKDELLYFLEIDRVIELFLKVGNDDPIKLIWKKDPVTGEEETIVE